jgi:hypothetical protein
MTSQLIWKYSNMLREMLRLKIITYMFSSRVPHLLLFHYKYLDRPCNNFQVLIIGDEFTSQHFADSLLKESLVLPEINYSWMNFVVER